MPNAFLLVDDCEADRYLSRRTIRDAGYTQKIIEFTDGSEFLELLADEAKLASFADTAPGPYLVILDINMPRVSGFEVARALDEWQQRNSQRDSFIVMMLSSSSHDRDKDRARQYEIIREFATKPLSSEVLGRIMNEPPAS